MKGIYLSGLDDLKTIGDKLFPDLPTMIIQLIATFILVLILAKFLVKPAKNFIAKRKEYIEQNNNGISWYLSFKEPQENCLKEDF